MALPIVPIRGRLHRNRRKTLVFPVARRIRIVAVGILAANLAVAAVRHEVHAVTPCLSLTALDCVTLRLMR